MGYQNNGQTDEGYNKDLDLVLYKGCSKTEKRYLNVEVYSYNGGPTSVRIRPCSKNTKADADPNKKWINQKGISQISKDEAAQLIKVLQEAITQF
jgi:hypothetical protein